MLLAQAGADVLKVFDSWAGILPEREFERWVIEPTRRIVHFVSANRVNANETALTRSPD